MVKKSNNNQNLIISQMSQKVFCSIFCCCCCACCCFRLVNCELLLARIMFQHKYIISYECMGVSSERWTASGVGVLFFLMDPHFIWPIAINSIFIAHITVPDSVHAYNIYYHVTKLWWPMYLMSHISENRTHTHNVTSDQPMKLKQKQKQKRIIPIYFKSKNETGNFIRSTLSA